MTGEDGRGRFSTCFTISLTPPFSRCPSKIFFCSLQREKGRKSAKKWLRCGLPKSHKHRKPERGRGGGRKRATKVSKREKEVSRLPTDDDGTGRLQEEGKK